MKTAVYFAKLAQLSYTVAPDIGQEDSAARIVFSRDTAKNLFAAIPGTNNESCALADIDASPSDQGTFGSVHRGIWAAFDSTWPAVLEKAKAEPIRVLTGHSEGAAGAIYIGARLCYANLPPAEIWAFEPPYQSIDERLGLLLKFHGVKVYIFRHGSDVVPIIPPPIEHPWRHAAPLIQFGPKPSIFPNVEDHMMQNLIPHLPLIPQSVF